MIPNPGRRMILTEANEGSEGGRAAIRPPLGLKPREFVEEERELEIRQAWERYVLAEMPVPPEWLQELEELLVRRYIREACREAKPVSRFATFASFCRKFLPFPKS